MRLWHQSLIPFLPRAQLLGQHRECAALRGNGWGKSHSTVNYVFNHDISKLVAFHFLVMDEMTKRGYKVSPEWRNPCYRGKNCEPIPSKDFNFFNNSIYTFLKEPSNIYLEHDEKYLEECIENLKNKGIIINKAMLKH